MKALNTFWSNNCYFPFPSNQFPITTFKFKLLVSSCQFLVLTSPPSSYFPGPLSYFPVPSSHFHVWSSHCSDPSSHFPDLQILSYHFQVPTCLLCFTPIWLYQGTYTNIMHNWWYILQLVTHEISVCLDTIWNCSYSPISEHISCLSVASLF